MGKGRDIRKRAKRKKLLKEQKHVSNRPMVVAFENGTRTTGAESHADSDTSDNDGDVP